MVKSYLTIIEEEPVDPVKKYKSTELYNGIPGSLIRRRLKRGWDEHTAISTPTDRRKPKNPAGYFSKFIGKQISKRK